MQIDNCLYWKNSGGKFASLFSLTIISLIHLIFATLSGLGINFFGSDPAAVGFGLFNAGGIIFMIVGISLSKNLADKYGNGMFLNRAYS